jgi:cell division protein ZapA (FtsZ GTPase activity inhibitor)
MIPSERPITFEILGERFTIKSDVSEDYFLDLVEKLNIKVSALKSKYPALSSFKLLAFAALDLADELYQREKRSRQEEVERIAMLSDSLASAIDEEGGPGATQSSS